MQVRVWRAVFAISVAVLGFCRAREAHAADVDAASAGVEDFKEFSLPNGMRVVLAVDRRVPQVALNLEYSVGEALDPPGQRGVAQAIGAILPQLETRHVHAVERSRLLRAAGLRRDEPKVSVSLDSTSLSLQTAPDGLELALWLEADRMGFGADGVTGRSLRDALPKLAKVLIRSPDSPDAFEAFRVGLGLDHPYGALMRAPDLAQLTAETVAARLRRYYNPASATLVLAGDFDPVRAEEAARKSFGSLPSASVALPRPPQRSSMPRTVSMSAPVAHAFVAEVWETPTYLAPDDAALDVIATVLARRLSAAKLCTSVDVGQRSRRLASVFVASCSGSTTTFDAWRARLDADLLALADAKVPAAEVESAAQLFGRITAERIDDPLGRASYLAGLVRAGHAARELPSLLALYPSIDVTQVAAVVRRYLLKPASKLEVTVSKTEAGVYGGPNEVGFQVTPETSSLVSTDTNDWARPPAKGPPPHYQPQTGLSDTLPSGDRLRFIEHTGVPLAHAEVYLPWPSRISNAAARAVLESLLEQAPTTSGPLQDSLKALGAELNISASTLALTLELEVPSRRLAPALALLKQVLSAKQLPKDGLTAAKTKASSWVDEKWDHYRWYWDVLGLSAPTSRYKFLPRSARTSLLSQLKYADVDRLWHATQQTPRSISLVGPFDNAAAQAFAADLARPAAASRPSASKTAALFRPGVYVLDTTESELVRGAVMLPLPPWATFRHFPAHLLPFLFRTDGAFAARLAAHDAKLEYWQSNTLITPDGDFFRYSFQVPLDQVAPMLESIKDHLAQLGSGKIVPTEFTAALIDEREFQVQQALTGENLLGILERAVYHDTETSDALGVPLGVDGVTHAQLTELARGFTLERATIGLLGPAARLGEVLAPIGLKTTSVTKNDPPAAANAEAGK